MLWAIGLRGAVAYALVVNIPRSGSTVGTKEVEKGIPAIETAALLTVVASTLVLGSAMGPLLRTFNLHGKTDADLWAVPDGSATGAAGSFGADGADNVSTQAEGSVVGGPSRLEPVSYGEIIMRLKEFDNKYLKPIFGGSSEDSSEDLPNQWQAPDATPQRGMWDQQHHHPHGGQGTEQQQALLRHQHRRGHSLVGETEMPSA
jgi:hypothetical protein